MLSKLKEFGKKPITWGAYGKLTIISVIISIIYMVIYLICIGLIKLPSFNLKKKHKNYEDLSTEES